MTVFYALCASIIMGFAIHMVLSRNLVRTLLGLSLLSTGANLALFAAGGFGSNQPPIIAQGAKALGVSADPLVQALTVVLASVTLHIWRATGSLDARDVTVPDQKNLADMERSVE